MPWKLYVLDSNDYFKIGLTKKIKDRVKALQIGNPIKLKTRGVFEIKKKCPLTIEKVIHKKLNEYRCESEWFASCYESERLLRKSLALLRELEIIEQVKEIKEPLSTQRWINSLMEI